MGWFNFIGLIFVIVLLVPNVVFAVCHITISFKNAVIKNDKIL